MYEFNPQDVFSFAAFVGAEVKEKGKELFFKRCPKCHGGRNDLDTFSVNLENGLFKCFRASCNYHGHFVELSRYFNFQLDDGQ